MMRCDSPPTDWYERPGFAEGNGFSALGACFRPCVDRYRVVLAGTCCKRLPNHMPDFCPQQQIYRVFRNGAGITIGPYAFVDYPAERGFRSKDQSAKMRALTGAHAEKAEWYQRCYRALGRYDYITRHVCDNADLLETSTRVRGLIATACSEIFCRYEPDGDLEMGNNAWMTADGFQTSAPGGSNKKSCVRIEGAQAALADKVGGAGMQLLRKTLKAATFCVILLIAVYSLINASPKVLGVILSATTTATTATTAATGETADGVFSGVLTDESARKSGKYERTNDGAAQVATTIVQSSVGVA